MEHIDQSSLNRKVAALLRRHGTARSYELEAAGLSRSQISRLVARGVLRRVARGLYAAADYRGGEHSALVTVAKRAPGVVFCLLTALRFHELTTQAPFEVWIAIGNKDHPPRIDHPPLRILRYASASLVKGVKSHTVEGVKLRVTVPAKTVADCFKFRNKVGLDVALEVLKEVRHKKLASADEIWRYAKINRVTKVMRPYMEAVGLLPGAPHRPTRDADFLGFGLAEEESLKRSVQTICAVAADDGMVFDPESITIEEIREDTRYGGLRVRLIGYLGSARCTVQLDVGYGDAVTPAPEEAIYPTLLTGLPAPHLKVYPMASVMSEKLESIVSLGMGNSRMKDYFDLRALAKEGKLDVHKLAEAIANTHRRRGTALPGRIPVGLSEEFAAEPSKRAQWQAFLTKNRIDAPELEQVVSEIREFIAEPLHLARGIIAFRG